MKLLRICDHSLQHAINTGTADGFANNLLGLYFLDGTNEVIRGEVIDFDRHSEQQEICKEVNILVRLARLQARK